MKRYGVRLSVRLSVPFAHSLQQRAAGFAVVGRREKSVECCSSGVWRANAGSAALSAYVGS